MKTIIEMAREADPKANLNEPYRLDHEKWRGLNALPSLSVLMSVLLWLWKQSATATRLLPCNSEQGGTHDYHKTASRRME